MTLLPRNISNIFLHNENDDTLLFKTALHCAELGKRVWYIAPHKISKIPNNVKIPDIQVLNSLTFLYLQKEEDIVKELNSIDLWYNYPQVIIVSKFSSYVSLGRNNNCTLLISLLLNASSVCERKRKMSASLIIEWDKTIEDLTEANCIIDLYFTNVVASANNENVFMEISNAIND